MVDPNHATWPAEAVDRFDRRSFGELLRSTGASRAAIDLLRIADQDYVGEGADAYSTVDMLGQAYNVRAAGRYLKVTLRAPSSRLPEATTCSLVRSRNDSASVCDTTPSSRACEGLIRP